MVHPRAARVSWTVTPHPVDVAGYRVPGEMLYWGQDLADASGRAVEPALVDPWLPVDWRDPDWHGETLPYWPSYSELAPRARAAYLAWLASGRAHPAAPIGYVFLFFYGLERRLLHDLLRTPDAFAAELSVIAREIDRLLAIYGGNASFDRYARAFRQTLLLLHLSRFDLTVSAPPAPDPVHVPAALRLGLSGFATAKLPVPAPWALAWVRSRIDHAPRTPATRCATELDALFAVRYRERFGDGLVLRPRAKDLKAEYHPASPGFRLTLTIPLPGRPDVFDHAVPLRKITTLVEECTDALDPYSRFLGRNPDGQGSVSAVALLPADLAHDGHGEAADLLSWASSYLGGMSMVTVPAEQLVSHLAKARAGEQPAKKDLVDVARVLDRAGVGMEPDPRMGGPVQPTGRIVLFRAEGPPLTAPSEPYRSATLLLHLGTAMSAADGSVSVEEKALLVGHLEKALDLSPGERTRLRAHLRWLLTTEPKLTGLTKRVSALDDAQKERVAGFLAAIAAADGVIDPAEVKLLKRIRKMLALDPEGVHASLHAAAVAPPPAAEPVPVRAAEPVVTHPIPAQAPPDGPIHLDPALLEARLAEAAQVAALLGSVFGADEEPPAPPVTPQEPPLAGLDAAHSHLLRVLAGRAEISRADWAALAAEARVMPDGALDRLNEAAIEHTGEPVAEGDDPIEINTYAMGELL
ncbi:TerB N-terminal domain-containing protein [Actinocorallia sp. API 0066]|uniref:tellurite resistance TerB family protein n=1 Tax=Actinocorallia sp. API 0066 TaxID=2896846 RepID=UPI001E2FE45B|nr:TerB N-terminal domain-containing protein [Actinocorallia sp. API 0066]MCD0452973.1 TerB N-terminal domain-containing protein [Actinocorallia sp. API 0066]